MSLSDAALDGLIAAMEAALVDDPDDRVAYCALADILIERGDPRGKFMQTQLALEDPSCPPSQRQGYQEREQKLLKKHGREWLGELAPYFLDENGLPFSGERMQGFHFQFARGWLDSLTFPWLDPDGTRILARAPQTRLLRRLAINQTSLDEVEPEILARAPFLGQLRILRLGDEDDDAAPDHHFSCTSVATGVEHLVALMPRLEELYLLAYTDEPAALFALPNLTNLRILQVYHLHDYPLGILAANPALGRLTHLLLHPGRAEYGETDLRLEHLEAILTSPHLKSLAHLRFRLTDAGDDGCATLVRSGALARLKTLDLQHGIISDEGARILAACPDLPRLEHLDLSDNALTPDGIAVLQATGVPLRAVGQHGPDDNEWRYQADIE